MYFEYYVFASRYESPTESERASGTYLREQAESRFLQSFFDPLYAAHSIGISTSDDEVISGAGLEALARAIESARRSLETQPATWLVTVGHRLEPGETEPGPAIQRTATRSSIEKFLDAAGDAVQRALLTEGYIHWGGGG